ncbi:MAG TPA: hypothetical protein VFS43_06130 [Polyangiaceae bacterium]|nr:hypothetical protein [Polyangiaceae bacterium]
MNTHTHERRRLTPVPAGWRACDDATLVALLSRASVIARGAPSESAGVLARAAALAARSGEGASARALLTTREQLNVERELRCAAQARLEEMVALMADLAADLETVRAENEELNREMQTMVMRRRAAVGRGAGRAGGRGRPAGEAARYAAGRRKPR